MKHQVTLSYILLVSFTYVSLPAEEISSGAQTKCVVGHIRSTWKPAVVLCFG